MPEEQLYITFRYAKQQKWKTNTLITFILVAGGIGSTSKFAVDP